MLLGCYSNFVIILCDCFVYFLSSRFPTSCVCPSAPSCLVGYHHSYKFRLVMLTVTYPNIIFLCVLSYGYCIIRKNRFCLHTTSNFSFLFITSPHLYLAIRLYVLCNSMANKIKHKPIMYLINIQD